MVTNNIYKPKEKFEMIFVTVAAVFNCGVFGYLINKLGKLLERLDLNQQT